MLIENWVIKNASYYINIAREVSKTRKRCLSRSIGSVLARNDSLLSTGFNGPPRGVPMCDEWGGNWESTIYTNNCSATSKKCPRKILGYASGQGLNFCPSVHAERNSLLSCARMGISTMDSVMFLTCGTPCKDCMIEIIQAGVKVIVVSVINSLYDDLSRRIAEKVKLPVIGLNSGLFYVLKNGSWRRFYIDKISCDVFAIDDYLSNKDL